MGRVMDDMNNCSRDCDVPIHCGRAARYDGGRVKTIKFVKRVVLAAVLIMSPWYAYAEAERFAGVQEQLSGLVSADAGFEAPAQEAIHLDQTEVIVPKGASLDVSAGGGSVQGGNVGQALASLDAAVDIGASRHVQNPQPGSIVSRDAASLEVVDTGVARHVQNPQPAAAMYPDAEVPVAREIEETISTLHETDELNADAASGGDQSARNYELMLPITDVAEKSEMTRAVVAATEKANGQAEDVSGSAASSEAIDLPFAVLLAILALMSMIPISRRNG